MIGENKIIDQLSFKVDSGLIDRLGTELVGRAETAVSELVKNCYDADATKVTVDFINTNVEGGTLKIVDNGLGMDLQELKKGFMTISSTDKVHNPKSIRYKRNKAGRKGIGRFATQRLGNKLVIITQKKENAKALKLTIDWKAYKIDTEIQVVKNKVEEIDKSQEEGTIILIEDLKEYWLQSEITRVYRYVSELLQPDYLSDRSEELGLAKQKGEFFNVRFIETIDSVTKVIADPDKMLFDKALAVIEGYIDTQQDGYCEVKSQNLRLEDDIFLIENKPLKTVTRQNETNSENGENQSKFLYLTDVHFKVYYFIYNRTEYYTNITKQELSNILKISKEQGGIRVYRNGFRVLPYGEPTDDWLDIDRRSYDESGVTNIPYTNQNFFGFVEVIDTLGTLFQETASREGLINNEAFLELKRFVSKSLEAAQNRIRYAVDKIRKAKRENEFELLNNTEEDKKNASYRIDTLKGKLLKLISELTPENKQLKAQEAQTIFEQIQIEIQSLLDELGMLRVLAGLGLTIGEFTHEVIQFSPSINGDLSVLGQQELDIQGFNSLLNLQRTIEIFTSYTSYFNSTVSANVSRELKPQDLDLVVMQFLKIISADLEKTSISISTQFYGYDLITTPMHTSEWSSILFNLYTNSKKAIRRANAKGAISIIGGKEKEIVYLEFSDNGDGIPEKNKERIFDAFFTTSSPIGFEASADERLTGTGLGLKIVKDIIATYGGTIEVIEPETGFNTCFRIQVPIVTEAQKEKHAI